MKLLLLTAAAALGSGFIWFGSRKWLSSEAAKGTAPDVVETADLAELSHLWTDDEIEIKDAASLWREKLDGQAAASPRPQFKQEEIDRFYTEMIEGRPSVKGARRTLIIRLLTLLDNEGDCPSVVGGNPLEAELKLPEDSFKMLARIPLYRHTLTVTRNFIAKADHDALVADMIIMALAHDIGKIPSYHNKMYLSGDHPIIAMLILKSFPEYLSLPNRSDIDRAITGHHLLKSDNILTNGLKESDHEARQSELALLYAEARERQQVEINVLEGKQLTFPAAAVTDAGGNSLTALPGEEREHPLLNRESPEQYQPVKIDVPAWFNAEALLAALKKRINKVESTPKGDKWCAVSINPGIVYVNTQGIWAAIRDICGLDVKVLAAEGNESEKRNIIYTVVRELSATRDALVTEYVADGYYTTQVWVVTGGGKRITSLLIPFRTQAFGEMDSTLELLKTPQLKRMVKDIKPTQAEVQKCAGP